MQPMVVNRIVDYIAYNKDRIDDLERKLKPYDAYYIAVDISLDELERREAARKTSPVGGTLEAIIPLFIGTKIMI